MAIESQTSPAGYPTGGNAVASGGATSSGGPDAPTATSMIPAEPTSLAVPAQPQDVSRAPDDLLPAPPDVIVLSDTVLRAIVTPPAGSPAARRRASRPQVVDPRVSQAKFDQQIKWFRDYEEVQRRRGLLLIEAAFPRLVVAVCVPHVRPNVVLFAIAIDYTNWDLEPPSVRVVDPFTLRPLLGKELISFMKRRAPGGHAAAAPGPQPELCMLQFGLPDEVPFLCLAGVREYHEHPAHTGDAWWLHRTTGAGSLSHLLNVFHSYAIAPITGFAPDIVLRMTPAGLAAEVRGLTLSTDLPA